MGAGIAAVAGIDKEPSSQRADIEEAQAELRQELAGRNERRRELDFLEKGGDPLEFKFGEALPGLWSLSPTDPLVKHHLPSEGRGSLSDNNHIKEADYNPEDCSESKRARGISGKFCFLDHSATTLPEALPTIISPSLEHDRKDPPKKESDACKNNKVAVKGQYARRNRQRSNRFSNGSTASRDLVKVGAEGGSSNALTVKDHAACDAEVKDVAKEITAQLITTDQVALRSGSADAKACMRVEQEKSSAALDLPETLTTVQASPTHDISEHGKELQACEPLLPETTLEEEGIAIAEQDEGPQSMDELPSFDSEEGRDMPSTAPSMDGEGKNLSLSVPYDSQAKNSTTMEESTCGSFLGANENRVASDDFKKSSSDAKIMIDSKKDVTEVVHVAGSDKTISAAGKIDLTSLADYQSTMDVAASECKQRLDTETSVAVIEYVNPALRLASDLCISEKKVQANNENLLEKEINNNELCDKAQRLEEVKVKVEHETSDAVGSVSVSRASLSPANVSNSQEEAPLQLQYPADGSMNSGCTVVEGLQLQASLSEVNGVPTDTLPVVAVPQEKTNLGEITKDVKTNLSPAAKKADKDTAAQEADGIKDPLKDSADWAKERTFQEPPRKKSHWDFVLEEMAWLANDFMQERLWKIAAAAQIARWVVKEKEFDEMEVRNRQCKIAQSLARAIKKFWSSVEARLLKGGVGVDNTSVDKAQKGIETVELNKARPVQAYALRFLKDFSGRQLMPQAEAPPTPDRVSECGIFDFWEGQVSEESLFYTVPMNAMEAYRQSVVTQWEGEYEQRLQEHESEMDMHVSGEAMEYSSGTYAVGPLVSPLVTGKRSSGVLGGANPTNRGSIPTKRMRTSAVAARQRAAGGTGPLVSIPLAHLARSDISSCETNSQQDEMTALLEGSSVSGRATDVDSNGAFMRNNLAVDGVDSPFKSKKKKKTRHFIGGHVASIGCDRDSEQLWQHNSHRQSELKEHSKQKADHAGIGNSGLEGLGAHTGTYHGAASVTSSANKLIKQITGRDRSRKYKGGKASSSQPGFGIPWSSVEDQAILGLVYELGVNWELVSDILSSNSQLKGIFRKPKDCKERYKMLTDRAGGEGGDSPDDPSSAHISMTQKGGTRFLPQHLEETLKSHVECILQLHQQLRSRKLQSESQEPKQLVPEHESHAIKTTAMTPLELCELPSTSSELVSYPLQPAHGNGLGIPNMLSSGVGMRPATSAMTALQGANNPQMSPSMSPSAAINAAATRDAQRMGVSMRPLAAEEQRLRYSRMVAGRGLQNPGLSVTSAGSPLMNLPNAADCTAPQSIPSGNNAGLMCGLSRGMPVTRTGLPGMGPVGVPNISAGMNNPPPSVGMGLSGAGAVNAGAVSSPVSMMRRPREAISMGHSPSAAQNNMSSGLSSPVVSSPTQNFSAQQQQQLLQHNTLQSQQQSPSSSQQQAYMMRVAKERQQMQQQQQKRMLQQQQSPTSNTLPSPFQSSQPLPASQQQHGLSPHGHLFPQQHQPSHLLMQQHTLPEPVAQQQHAVPPSAIPQSAVSPSGQPSLSSNSQNSQQQQSLSQTHQPTSTASSTQPPFQTKHHNLSVKQQQQQQSKNMKGMGRGEGQPTMLPSQVSSQIPGQQMPQVQRMGDSQGTLPQHLAGASVQNIPANMSQVADVGSQQFQQKGFPHLPVKHMSQQQVAPPSIQPTSPPTGASAPQQQQSPGPVVSLQTTQQQRRTGQQSQSQQRRPQQSQAGMSLGTQVASQSGKTGLQPSSLPSQLPVGFQLGSNTNSPLSMTSPSSGVPLSSPNNSGSGGFSSPQWKPGQNFTPMAAGLYNLSRSNSGIAAQAPHLAMSVGMHLPLSNGKIPVAGNSLVTHEISRGGSPHVTGHVGALSQKASAGSAVNSRAMPVSQHTGPSQRQLAQQQQLNCTSGSTGGQQLRPASSGSAPAPE